MSTIATPMSPTIRPGSRTVIRTGTNLSSMTTRTCQICIIAIGIDAPLTAPTPSTGSFPWYEHLGDEAAQRRSPGGNSARVIRPQRCEILLREDFLHIGY